MCGITGIFTLNKQQNPNWIKKMTNVISHRGPDADGFFMANSKKLSLGHRRLSIIDLSVAANQPMYSSCRNFVMVFNGEIYNYKELAKKYNIKTKTSSDTEVVLELFIKLGKYFVKELNGMFAIAIYDKQNEKLWLFRDRVGIKPLYFYWNNENFLFASELKSIKSVSEDFPLSVNKKAIASFLRLGYIPEPMSIYNEVRKFPSASIMAVSSKGYRIDKYWTLKIDKQNQLKDEQKAKIRLKELLESSIKYRLMADVPFGTNPANKCTSATFL